LRTSNSRSSPCMPRSVLAYLNDIVEACDSVAVYPAIIDDTVWAIADRDAPILREECRALIEELRRAE
jgi:uncharacterized protein with HEPN domain